MFLLKENEKPLDNIKENCGFASILKDVGVIGDSLSSGEFEATNEKGETTYHDMYEYSWPQILENITKTKYINYSRGGMSFKEFYETYANEHHYWNKHQCYIVNLGSNDLFVFNQEVRSVDDINLLDPSKIKIHILDIWVKYYLS